jgi:hypothetical protein
MPEYFDISLIGPKTNSSTREIEACLNKLGFSKGENASKQFSGVPILVSVMDSEDIDFEELSIGLADWLFHKPVFDEELKLITNFVEELFECNSNFQYALCSYELNGYLIGGVNKFEEFSNASFLNRFPIVYKRGTGSLLVEVHTDAQIIFKEQ